MSHSRRARARASSALGGRAERLLMTAPAGDGRAAERVAVFAQVEVDDDRRRPRPRSRACRRGLFSPDRRRGRGSEEDVVILSAPGESRECVEIARLRSARGRARRALRSHGDPAARAAPVPRAPRGGAAARRASRRTSRAAPCEPDPAGRALLGAARVRRRGALGAALRRVPLARRGARRRRRRRPPARAPVAERWVPPDEELLPSSMTRAARRRAGRCRRRRTACDRRPIRADRARARCARRGAGSACSSTPRSSAGASAGRSGSPGAVASCELDRDDARERGEDAMAERIRARARRRSITCAASRCRCSSELEALAAAPRRGASGSTSCRRSRRARCATPSASSRVLAELAPMADVGPVDLPEVRLVLERRLTELVVRPGERARTAASSSRRSTRRAASRSTSCSCPASPRRLFPQKVAEDPILRDRERARARARARTQRRSLGGRAPRAAPRGRRGAASSSSRIRASTSSRRARACRRSTGSRCCAPPRGSCPGFDELARRAEQMAAPRASAGPRRRARATPSTRPSTISRSCEPILERARERDGGDGALPARRERAPRARAALPRAALDQDAGRRADGLVDPDPPSAKRARSRAHARSARARSRRPRSRTSPRARTGSCSARCTGSRRAKSRRRSRSSTRCSAARSSTRCSSSCSASCATPSLLPVTAANLRERARGTSTRCSTRSPSAIADELAPAIERVWDDGIAAIRADLREWLRRAADEAEWIPAHFELSFGLAERRDQRSAQRRRPPCVLDGGIRLRGSIDLVERRADGALRATDYKTGKARAPRRRRHRRRRDPAAGALRARAREALSPSATSRRGASTTAPRRATSRTCVVPLDDEARDAASDGRQDRRRRRCATGFFPAAPAQREAASGATTGRSAGRTRRCAPRKVKRKDRARAARAALRKRE